MAEEAAGIVRRRADRRLTIEAIVAVDPPREFRIHPRDRVVAFTAEAAGARQVFTLSLRGTGRRDPDHGLGEAGERPAVVARRPPPRLRARRRDLDRRGGRLATHPRRREAGWRSRSALVPDGRRLAFLSRRRGWTQVWLVDAPVPRRGRPHATRSRRGPTALTAPGIDVDALAWSPDGARLAVTGPAAQPDDLEHRGRSRSSTSRAARAEIVAGSNAATTSGRSWLPDGSLLYVSDADGWFQVIRRIADGRDGSC